MISDPTSLLKSLSDAELKQILEEYNSLHNANEPSLIFNQNYKALVHRICKYYNHPFSLSLGDSFILDEVVRRWIKTVK